MPSVGRTRCELTSTAIRVHSSSHPQRLCPLSSLEGWTAPTCQAPVDGQPHLFNLDEKGPRLVRGAGATSELEPAWPHVGFSQALVRLSCDTLNCHVLFCSESGLLARTEGR